MDPRRRKELARYGAPAAFLAAVTIAVILIKSGLSGGSGSTTTGGLFPTTTRTATFTESSWSSRVRSIVRCSASSSGAFPPNRCSPRCAGRRAFGSSCRARRRAWWPM